MKFGFFIKVIVLVFSFVGVIYAMRLLQAPDRPKPSNNVNSVMGLLAGSDLRLLSWCPEGLLKIEVYSETDELVKTLSINRDFASVCELMVGGVVTDPAKPMHFKIKLKAIRTSGSPVLLEMDYSSHVFQVKGMPFSSAGLLKVLDRLSIP
ncbi:MAG: hypothetical protein ACXVCN_16345 [Bdellovibrio sp.]